MGNIINPFRFAAAGGVPDGLVAYYRFNDTLVDEVSGHDGTGVDITYATGKSGNAASFNGSSSKVTIPSATTLGILDNSSLSMYLKIDDHTSKHGIFECKDYRGWGSLHTHTDELIWFYYTEEGGIPFKSTSTTHTISDATWVHVVLTRDFVAGELKIYLDSVLRRNLDISSETGAFHSTELSTIGISYVGTWDGLIDGFGIWDKALSQAEVTSIYNTQNGGDELV